MITLGMAYRLSGDKRFARNIYFKPGENLVTIDMRGEKDWDGELINLAFTPACDVSSGTFGIDYIRLLNCEAEVSFCNQTSPFRNKKQ